MKLTRPQKNVLRKIAAGWSLQEHRRRTASKPHFYLFEENEQVKVSSKTVNALRKTPFWRCLACEQIPVANCSFALAYYIQLEKKWAFEGLLNLPSNGIEFLRLLSVNNAKFHFAKLYRNSLLAVRYYNGNEWQYSPMRGGLAVSASRMRFVNDFVESIEGTKGFYLSRDYKVKGHMKELLSELFDNLDA